MAGRRFNAPNTQASIGVALDRGSVGRSMATRLMGLFDPLAWEHPSSSDDRDRDGAEPSDDCTDSEGDTADQLVGRARPERGAHREGTLAGTESDPGADRGEGDEDRDHG